MADSPKNKAFLQQLERQRLNKTCKLPIDLRGKVAGECQAYSFGDLTHYLDDRAYLLAKQLLDRFDGRYTIGVNEVLLKVLKSLEVNNTKQEAKPILACNKGNVEFISFDSLIHRKEPRILHATAIELRINDVLYHATTINITTSAIRIASKRTFTLENGSPVTVNFTEFVTSSQPELLTKVHYKILSIEHDEQRSYAILVRNRSDDEAVSSWLDKWTQDRNTPEHIDIDNELFNLVSHYYLRAFIATMHSPLFWLGNKTNSKSTINAFHNMPLANSTLIPLQLTNYEFDFSLLPLQKILEQQSDYLVFIYTESGIPKSIAIPRNNHQLITLALGWHAQQENNHVLLLKTQETAIQADDFKKELQHLAENDSDYALTLTERLNAISHLVSLIDITASCKSLPPHNTTTLEVLNSSHTLSWSGIMPKPTPLQHYIDRKSQRLFIKTKVVLDLHQKSHELTSRDVSEFGMSLNLTGFVDLIVGSHVKVNFEHWQSQTDTVKLNAIPYIIRGVQFWEGTTQLGLERNFPACSESVNRFFSSKITHHKGLLSKNTHDISIVQEAKIFTHILGQKLSSIPFYLAIDTNKTRILQAVASSKKNHAKDLSGLWQVMQILITPLYSLLRSDKSKQSIYFGLYSYIDSSGEWKIMTDYDLSTPRKKSIFINRALSHEIHYFFHSNITLIPSCFLKQQGDLNQRLSELRSHSPHKIKQIREVLHSLLAIGELTDITDIISSTYL